LLNPPVSSIVFRTVELGCPDGFAAKKLVINVREKPACDISDRCGWVSRP